MSKPDPALKLAKQAPTHIVIPDTQAKPGVPVDHLWWIGQYVVDQFAGRPNVKLIHLGDHPDMPSLSSYDKKGGTKMEGRRYVEDIEAANDGWDCLNTPLHQFNRVRVRNGRDEWLPERHYLRGNHDDRITRAAESDAQLEGLVSLDDLNIADWGWTVHDYLFPVLIDGVWYAHFFANPMTGRAYSGQSMDLRLKTIGHSFSMGHQQGLLWGRRETIGGGMCGLVAGSCYLHDEDYKGPQGNGHWRGIVVCHQVENGEYDPMFVSLDYLCRRYEGVRLDKFTKGL